jgi:imidazolonepropionase-like amidohydrolase
MTLSILRFTLLSVFVFACTCGRAQNPTPAAEQSGPIAVTNATIHVGNGTVLENATLLLRDGRIEAIGTDVTVPAGYETVDATGKEVYPGLIALNSQLGLTEIGAVRATNDQAEVGVFNPNARALIAFNTDSQVIPTVRSRGVLIAQTTPEGSLVSGRSSMVQLDGWNYEDAALRADDGLHVNWPSRYRYNWMTGELKPSENYAERVRELEQFLEQAVAYCGRAEGEGDRLLKLEAFCEAASGGANLYLHADEARDIQAGVLLLKKMGGKPVVVGGYQAYLITDFLKREDVSVILSSTQALPDRPGDAIDQPFRNPALLAEAGVEFAISHEGYWQQRNLPFVAGQAVGFGLDYEKAIEALTLAPARITGIDEDYGSLEAGKSATFIVVAGDVLDMRSSRVERAFIDGRDVNLDNKQAELYRKFDEKYQRARK